MAFQTAFRPRPVRNERPPMPIVPIERVQPSVRPTLQVVDITPPADQEQPWYWSDLGTFAAPIRAKAIKHRVADRHKLEVAQLDGISRARHIVSARDEAIAEIALANPDWSTTQIGKCFNRDHTTILASLHRTGTLRVKRPFLQEEIWELWFVQGRRIGEISEIVARAPWEVADALDRENAARLRRQA